MAIYFISDLHLEASREDITEAFFRFLNTTASDATALYILGDFFDAWIGDDWNSKLIKRIKRALLTCRERGVHTYFIHGNRDFLLGQRFANETGLELLKEETVIELNGQRVLILHGDSLCTDDADYIAWRNKTRTQEWQRKILRLPLFARKLIAANYRRKSKKANANKADNITDVSEYAVKRAFERHNVSLMIHGHTHRPDTHTLSMLGKDYTRMVLGDWDKEMWYIRADNKDIKLVHEAL